MWLETKEKWKYEIMWSECKSEEVHAPRKIWHVHGSNVRCLLASPMWTTVYVVAINIRLVERTAWSCSTCGCPPKEVSGRTWYQLHQRAWVERRTRMTLLFCYVLTTSLKDCRIYNAEGLPGKRLEMESNVFVSVRLAHDQVHGGWLVACLFAQCHAIRNSSFSALFLARRYVCFRVPESLSSLLLLPSHHVFMSATL